ncbi:hypothetical protein FS749_006222 [Ceratobasidium sp. UAMH 11750]|nr:hypothetical protein FS749_006222 [Ceratobasidium sp. UAMH 11750]
MSASNSSPKLSRFGFRPLFNPSTPSPPSSPTQRYLELFGATPEPGSPSQAGVREERSRSRVFDGVEIPLLSKSIVPDAVRDFWKLREAAFTAAVEDVAEVREREEAAIRSSPRAFGHLETKAHAAKIRAAAKRDRKEIRRSRDAEVANHRQEAESRLHPVDHFLLDLALPKF